MKKITILALHLGYGGIEKFISSLCMMLSKKYEIEIVSTYKKLDEPCFEIPSNVKITYLINSTSNREEVINNLKSFRLFSCIKEIIKSIKLLYLKRKLNIKAIKNTNSDYIITTRVFHNNLVNKYAKKDIIKIATDHNYHNNDKKYIKSIVNSTTNFDYFVAISQELYNDYKKVLKTKCVYIPNTIDNVPLVSSKLDNKNIISIGRLEKVKGFEDLIEIAHILKNRIDYHFNIIGDGSEKKNLQNRINELDLNDNVTLVGYKNKKEIETYLLDSSLYVMTSHSESFGISILEAMSYGLPVVVFDSAKGSTELINNKELIINNRNKDLMANKIIELLNNKEKSNDIGKMLKKNAYQYTIDNISKKWIDLMEEVQ